MRIPTPLCLAMVALLSGCGEPGEVYPQPAGQIRAALISLDEAPPVFGSIPLDMSAANGPNGSIVWSLSQSNATVLRFIAHTKSESENSTRVWVDITGPTDKEDDPVTQRLAENASVRDLYKTAMTEQIDALLEKRDFDLSKIAGQASLAVIMNIGSITGELDKAADEFRRRDAENISRAYREEASGAWPPHDSDVYSSREPAFGEPMDTAAGSDY